MENGKKESCSLQSDKNIKEQIVLQLESSGLSMGHFGADITDSNFVQMQEVDIRKRYAKEERF